MTRFLFVILLVFSPAAFAEVWIASMPARPQYGTVTASIHHGAGNNPTA
jgi:hypothetical protein